MSLLISVLILLGAWVYFPKTMLAIVAVCTIVMIYFMWEAPLFDDLEKSNEQKRNDTF